jgi:hypothetical protein
MGLLDRIIGTPRDRFAREVLRAVRSAPGIEAWYEPEQFRIRYRRGKNDDASGWVYLSNVYRECEGANRAERDQRIIRLVEHVVASHELPDGWADVAPRLRPVLRPVTFAQGRPADTPGPLSRPALPHLREFVVIDRPTSMAYVTGANLAKWSVTAEHVFDRARSNLTAMAALPAAPPPDGPMLMRFVENGDAYFVSRLLVYGWLASLASRVGGRPVAFIPDQNTLIVTDDRPDGLAPLFELIEKEYNEAVRSLSPMAYSVDEHGEMVPYPAPSGHPLAAVIHRAEVLLAASEYSAQQHWLEQTHDDVHIAAFVVAQRPDQSVFSCATWTDGVASLLPQTEYVSFTSATEAMFFVPWDVVEREAGLVAVPDLDPPRFRVAAWPPDPIVKRLRAAAVEL